MYDFFSNFPCQVSLGAGFAREQIQWLIHHATKRKCEELCSGHKVFMTPRIVDDEIQISIRRGDCQHEIAEELEEAASFNDPGRHEKLGDERQAILDQIPSGPRPRWAGLPEVRCRAFTEDRLQGGSRDRLKR